MCTEGVNVAGATGNAPMWSTLDKVTAGASAVGSFTNSMANRQAMTMQAEVQRNNAQVADWQAGDAKLRGDKAAQAVALKGRQMKGAQRAGLAANGVDLGEGSALQLLTDTDFFNAQDVNTAHDNANKEAWYFRNQALGMRANADIFQQKADMENPFMAAGTSLLTSAGRVSERWYKNGGGGPAAPSGPRRGGTTFGEGQY